MNTDLGFLVSLVESELRSNPETNELGDSALLDACMEVAVYAIPLPERGSDGVPHEFLQLAVQVGREAYSRVSAGRGETPAAGVIDETVLAKVCLFLGTPEPTVPARMPRSAYLIGEGEVNISPSHARLVCWYVSMDSKRTSWVLWDFTPNWRECGLEKGDWPMAMISRHGISRETAVRHLLVAFLRTWEPEGYGGEFHSVTPCGILTFDDFDAVSAAVWGSDDEDDGGTPLIDMNRINDVVIRAWRERISSLKHLDT